LLRGQQWHLNYAPEIKHKRNILHLTGNIRKEGDSRMKGNAPDLTSSKQENLAFFLM
jgi:hypothetical protein